MKKENESILVSWCDNGMMYGATATSLINAILECQKMGMKFSFSFRCFGNQIARQRQFVFDYWENEDKSDWLLFIDSDIVISPESLYNLWQTADKDFRPIVTGVYFITNSLESEKTEVLMSTYKFFENTIKMDSEYIKNNIEINLGQNNIVQINSGGLGYCLIHKSVIKKIKQTSPNKNNLFQEFYIEDEFISEDVSFFMNVKRANIPVYTQTSSLAQHMKIIPVGLNSYRKGINNG